jgi:hypothetical protein
VLSLLSPMSTNVAVVGSEHWWRIPGQDAGGRDRLADARLGQRFVLRVPPGESISLDRAQLAYLRDVVLTAWQLMVQRDGPHGG